MSDSRGETGDDRFQSALLEVDETVIVASARVASEGDAGTGAGPADDIQGMSAAPSDDIQGMSYESARDALVDVVDRLERGGTTLEESLALWERGEALAARCETWLIGARARLDAARGSDGEA
jgi:exodeoxyribonuclease VII small subunit